MAIDNETMRNNIGLTILTPTFNCGATIAETLESVEELSLKLPGRIQHLIGDAGSTDGTLEKIMAYAERYNWVVILPCAGMNIPATLNALLRAATGAWVQVLNGDDAIYPAKVAELFNDSSSVDTADILCGDVDVCSVDGQKIGTRHCRIDKLDNFMSINHPSMLVRQSIFPLIGNFSESVPTTYDYIWTYQAYKAHIAFLYIGATLAKARLGGISQSRARKGAREIFAYKAARGEWRSATVNYAGFLIKELTRHVLPDFAVRVLIKRYRILNDSVDNY